MPDLYIGLMSGTSLDGIDAGLVDFSTGRCQVVDFLYQPFTDNLKNQLSQLSSASRSVSLQTYGQLDVQLGYLFAETCLKLLEQAKIPPQQVKAIGSHGLTVHHAPTLKYPFSLQIGDPNIIAETTDITAISDFRRRDMAAGGQGAPLVPAFHQYYFADHLPACIVNIGGIANITALSHSNTLGFDTGPGNTLMDYWIGKHLGQAYDKHGQWAQSGRISPQLLKRLKSDPYFAFSPPKSTGKEYFSPAWLIRQLQGFSSLAAEDVQATLCRLTADTICDAIKTHAANCQQVIVCGGGSHNAYLMHLLNENLDLPVSDSQHFGINPDQVEAIAFAWLAQQTLNRQPGNLCSATGANRPVILGGIYPGKMK